MSTTDPFETRKRLYAQIEEARNSKVITYVTGDRRNMETHIHHEVADLFSEHLDAVSPTQRITLVLYTRGGETLAAWSLVNLIRMFCDDFEVLIPANAHSAGTLLSLGADRIIMTKQATLGPIDPSLSGPLCPQIPGASPAARASVSVEAVKGYLEFANSEVGISTTDDRTRILLDLAQKVHPLVLGEIFRAKSQIKYLAKELLAYQTEDERKQDRIIDFLTSESGSHDYTINRREAERLGLAVEAPDEGLYGEVKELYASIRAELALDSPFDARFLVASTDTANYSCTRCLLESVNGGAHMYLSTGTVTKVQSSSEPSTASEVIRDTRTFNGWKHR